MNTLSEMCSVLPGKRNFGMEVSAVPPLIPERLTFYFYNGETYDQWNRVFCHNSYIAIYVISGSRIVNIDDCFYTLNPNDLIIIPPYSKHFSSDDSRDFESLMISFVIPGDSRRMKNICSRSWKLTKREDKTIRTVLNCFTRYLNGNSAAAEETVCHFAVLLRQIQSIASPTMESSKIYDAELPLLNRITAYLAANIHRHVSLDELSRELYVSGSTIRQTFRKKMNVSIGRYQLIQRLNHGLRLLKSTKLSVAEIAEKIGFASANGFFLAIKRECNGLTPKMLRKK